MDTKQVELDLQIAILQTGLLQPVSSNTKDGHLEILCRQVPGREKNWIRVLQAILTHLDGTSIHICRRYLLKDGKLVFGWHIQLDCANVDVLTQVAGELKGVLEGVTQSLGEQEEVSEEPQQPTVIQQALQTFRPPPDPNYQPMLEGVVGGKEGVARTPPLRGGGAPVLPPNQTTNGRPLAPGQHPPQRQAAPRAPSFAGGEDGKAPSNFVPRLKVVEVKKNSIVTEMPLPHVYKELNVPNEKERGATYVAGSD